MAQLALPEWLSLLFAGGKPHLHVQPAFYLQFLNTVRQLRRASSIKDGDQNREKRFGGDGVRGVSTKHEQKTFKETVLIRRKIKLRSSPVKYSKNKKSQRNGKYGRKDKKVRRQT